MTRSALQPTGALPSVSVIVPCYRCAERADRLVSALLRQDSDAELIFVDDGSGDATAETLRALTSDHARTRVVVHAANRGRAAARNTGIEAATGEVLLFLDADMAPEPGFVRAHAEAHLRDDIVGVLSTPRLRGLVPANPYHEYLRSRLPKTTQSEESLPFRRFIIGYTSVKRHAIDEVGGFDERFTYGEDIDFAYRLWCRFPQGIMRSGHAVVHHYEHGSLDDRLEKLREFGARNLPLLLRKHPDIAPPANLDFATPRTLQGGMRSAALRLVPRRTLRRAIPHLPSPIRSLAVRYLMAATVYAAFRGARSERPTR